MDVFAIMLFVWTHVLMAEGKYVYDNNYNSHNIARLSHNYIRFVVIY